MLEKGGVRPGRLAGLVTEKQTGIRTAERKPGKAEKAILSVLRQGYRPLSPPKNALFSYQKVWSKKSEMGFPSDKEYADFLLGSRKEAVLVQILFRC